MQSNNILSNIGSASGLAYQEKMNRVKGSCPFLITKGEEVVEYLSKELEPLLLEYSDDVLSRVSVRFFLTESSLYEFRSIIQSFHIRNFSFQIEAEVKLKNYYWVWIGGNIPARITDKKIVQLMKDKITNIQNSNSNKLSPVLLDGYQISELRNESEERKNNYINQMSVLYSERIPVYVTDNNNAEYIKRIVESKDSDVYVIVDSLKNVMGVVINEYTHYEIMLPNKEQVSIKICESNDWIKSKDCPSEFFDMLLARTIEDAQNKGAQIIEAECVPEAYRTAIHAGFHPAEEPLMRTSLIQTDGKNIELYEEHVAEYYRKFNSLWLFTIVNE
ncbi:MAG: hypothetical protein WCO06_06890 [Candidatus Roizmanbacteria bacterium]